ncbi:MAG: hypothetical protein WAQ07_05680 [Candidatus Omnitrophota bacterium]
MDDVFDEFMEYDFTMGSDVVKCPHCSAEWTKENRRGDCDRDGHYYFDEIPYLECNINIIATHQATYVEVRNNKGYNSSWHIDYQFAFGLEELLENASDFTNKLEKSIEEVLEEE